MTEPAHNPRNAAPAASAGAPADSGSSGTQGPALVAGRSGPAPAMLSPVVPSVEFDAVSFAYPDGTQALSEVSATLSAWDAKAEAMRCLRCDIKAHPQEENGHNSHEHNVQPAVKA